MIIIYHGEGDTIKPELAQALLNFRRTERKCQEIAEEEYQQIKSAILEDEDREVQAIMTGNLEMRIEEARSNYVMARNFLVNTLVAQFSQYPDEDLVGMISYE